MLHHQHERPGGKIFRPFFFTGWSAKYRATGVIRPKIFECDLHMASGQNRLR
jgi:hypothetical protein